MKIKHPNIQSIEDFLNKTNRELNFSIQNLYNLNKILFAEGLCAEGIISAKHKFMKDGCEYIARDLLKIKYKRNNNSAKNIKEGFVYAITNPSWPDYVKVGSAIDVYDRLNSYQTSSPKRDYKLETYVFVEDRIEFEKYIHSKYKCDGEWVKDLNVLNEFKMLKKNFSIEVKKIVVAEYLKSLEKCNEVLNQTTEFRKLERLWILSIDHLDNFTPMQKREISKELRMNSSWKLLNKTRNKNTYKFSMYNIQGVVNKDRVKLIYGEDREYGAQAVSKTVPL